MRTALLIAAWLVLPLLVGTGLARLSQHYRRPVAPEAKKLRRTMVAIRTHPDGMFTLTAKTTEMDSGPLPEPRLYGMPWYDHPKVKVPS